MDERKKRELATKLVTIPIKNIKQGPIRHSTLDPELLKEIKFTYDRVGRLYCPTLEEWEIGFMRDMHPQREVTLWTHIAQATELYLKKYVKKGPGRASEGQRFFVSGKYVQISGGEFEAKKLKVSQQKADRLCNCWHEVGGQAKPVIVLRIPKI